MKAMICAVTLVFLLSFLSISPYMQTVKAGPAALIVPDDYSTISSAVSAALPGDTVFVRSGTYYENVLIDKPLTLVGESSTNTTVIGSGGPNSSFVFTISADSVKISGFKIESLNYSTAAFTANGISVEANNCSITGNNIMKTYRGIYGGGQGDLCGGKSSTTVSQNNITSNLSYGILFYGGTSNVISENNIEGNGGSGVAIDGYSNVISGNNISYNKRGIGLGSAETVISGNNITGNLNWGIYFETSNNVIINNYIAGSKYGIYLSSIFAPQNNTFYHNDFVNNTSPVFTGSVGNVEVWDNGYPSGGNYWSSYHGVDEKNGINQDLAGSDGIGDTPAIIDANNTDRYPFMAPLTLENSLQPYPPSPPNSTQARWEFDDVEPNELTPDAFIQNPAVLLAGNTSTTNVPLQVPGKFGSALSFHGPEYVWAEPSPTLEITGEITIDAWIYVKGYENETYNNIVVNSVRILNEYGLRLYGLAVNGLSPENATSGPQGALCGYVYTDTGGYNEIVTVAPAVSLNQWTHVTFTRSLTTGMHLYVNGQEQKVKVTAGVQNPQGTIKAGTDFYIGADYVGNIDRVYLSNAAFSPQPAPLFTLWWVWTIVALGIVFVLGTFYFSRRKNIKTRSST